MAAIGESGNAAYFQGGLLDIILADAIIAFDKNGVTFPLVSVKGSPKGDTTNWIAYNTGTHKVQSADVAATAEGTVTPESALTTNKKTATHDMYSINVPIYDEAELSNADSITDNVGQLVGAALAGKIDNLLNAAFDNFSNAVGTSTVALTVDNLFSAIENLQNNSAPGQVNGVFYPSQIWGTYGLSNDLITSANYAGGSIQDEGARNGFVTKVAGVNIHTSPEFTESGSAVKGGIFTAGALGYGYSGELFRLKEWEDPRYVRKYIIGSFFGGVAEIVDGWGVEVHTKTS